MRNMMIILLNTLRVTFRKRSAFLVYLVLPIGGVLVGLALMSGSGSRPVRVGVVNEDSGRFGADLVSNMRSWGDYETTLVEASNLDTLIVNGKLDCGLIIPKGFTESVVSGSMKKIRLVSIKGAAVTAALESILGQYSASLADLANAAAGDQRKLEKLYANATQAGVTLTIAKLASQRRDRDVTVTSLGFLILFVMLGATLTSQIILTEKQNRTFYRISSAPVLLRQYLAGNGGAGLLIVIVQIIVVLIVMRGILGIDTAIPDLLLVAILALFGLVSVGLGMLLTSFARSSSMAAMLSTLIVTPTCIVAGCFVPSSLMPQFMQKIGLFMPQHWVLDAITKLQNGTGTKSVLMNLLILLAFALAFFLVAIYGFARQEESGQFV